MKQELIEMRYFINTIDSPRKPPLGPCHAIEALETAQGLRLAGIRFLITDEHGGSVVEKQLVARSPANSEPA